MQELPVPSLTLDPVTSSYFWPPTASPDFLCRAMYGLQTSVFAEQAYRFLSCHVLSAYHTKMGSMKVGPRWLSVPSQYCKWQDDAAATSFCGSPAYLSPEMVSRNGHGQAGEHDSVEKCVLRMCSGPFLCDALESMIMVHGFTFLCPSLL